MSIRKLKLLVLIATAALTLPASGHEPDQYTYPPDREFADVGGYLTRYFYGVVERGVNKTNERIKDALSSGRKDDVRELQSPDAIAHAVNRELPVALFLIESLDDTLSKPESRQHYPGHLVDYKLNSGDLRKYIDIPLSPFNAWKCGSFKAFGTFMGADKIGHFTDMGMHYFDHYRSARADGKNEEAAVRTAIKLGTDDPVYSEKGLLGWATAGAYSNADLVANFTGFLFYRNLSEPVMLKGEVRKPILELDGGYWKISQRVRPDSDFYSLLISDHLNEAFNPSVYIAGMRPKIRRAIAERSTGFLEQYRDRFGNRHSAEWFRAKQKELSTYYGVYYGHLGDEKDLMLIPDVCFGSAPDRIDGRDLVGRTPLHISAERGDIPEMQRLINRGADVNAQVRSSESQNSDWGNTPLIAAAREGRTEAVRLLLSLGANVNAANHRGVTALHMASHHAPVAELLLASGARADLADAQGCTPLQWAAFDPDDKEAHVVAALVRAGAAINWRDHDGHTALAYAAAASNADAAFMLVKSGADVNLADRFAAAPLHVAARTGDPQLVDILLRAHAAPNGADAFGCTPLHDATRVGSTYSVALLLKSGADPKVSDDYCATPLHLASRVGNAEIASMLLEHGADVAARTSSGMMAIDEAEKSGAAPVVALLKSAAAPKLPAGSTTVGARMSVRP